MFQITSPLVAEALNKDNKVKLESLLKKTSINLIIVSGFFFLLINLNLNDFYQIINQKGYASAASVVIIVSLGKLFTMSMGCTNNIISNSKYYTYVFWFSISSAILAIILNYNFIKAHGIIGAAFATLIVIVIFNLLKIILVQYLFKIHPYSKKTLGVLLSVIIIYLLVINLPSLLNPWLSILLRSLLILGLFCIPLFVFRWSSELDDIFKNFKKRLL